MDQSWSTCARWLRRNARRNLPSKRTNILCSSVWSSSKTRMLLRLCSCETVSDASVCMCVLCNACACTPSHALHCVVLTALLFLLIRECTLSLSQEQALGSGLLPVAHRSHRSVHGSRKSSKGIGSFRKHIRVACRVQTGGRLYEGSALVVCARVYALGVRIM
jgi:hypothetical protein